MTIARGILGKLSRKFEEYKPQSESNVALIESIQVMLGRVIDVELNEYIRHWNVQSPSFSGIHEMLKERYEKLAEFKDDLAERLRQLEVKVVVVPSGIEREGAESDGDQLIKNSIDEVGSLLLMVEDLEKLMAQVSDTTTSDILIQFKRWMEKSNWMMRSTLTIKENENA